MGNSLVQTMRAFLLRHPGLTAFLSHVLISVEKMIKIPVFGCHMCGQCVLHSTGMVCPMTCPKNLRNGPCGGVRLNNRCEVEPEMECVWVKAYRRSQRLACPKHSQGERSQEASVEVWATLCTDEMLNSTMKLRQKVGIGTLRGYLNIAALRCSFLPS